MMTVIAPSWAYYIHIEYSICLYTTTQRNDFRHLKVISAYILRSRNQEWIESSIDMRDGEACPRSCNGECAVLTGDPREGIGS
jgi:hypothetical protein